MIVGGQTSARVLTIIDYHASFDQGFSGARKGKGVGGMGRIRRVVVVKGTKRVERYSY